MHIENNKLRHSTFERMAFSFVSKCEEAEANLEWFAFCSRAPGVPFQIVVNKTVAPFKKQGFTIYKPLSRLDPEHDTLGKHPNPAVFLLVQGARVLDVDADMARQIRYARELA